MNEKIILKVSMIAAIIGLVFLFFYSEAINVSEEINFDNLPAASKKLQIRGTINSISQKEKAIFLNILGEKIEPVDVVIFNDQELILNKGDFVEIVGTAEDYHGKQEIIADKITLHQK